MNEFIRANQIVTHIAKETGLNAAQAQAEFDAHASAFGYKVKNCYSRNYGTRIAKAVAQSVNS